MQAKAVSLSKTAQHTQWMRAMAMGVMALTLLILQASMALAKPESLAPLAEKISPSVVNITTSTTVEGRTGPQGIVPEGSPFEDFFREFQDRNNDGEGNRPRRSSALGSGFVISEDGYVVTNNHVIESADEITIEFFSGEELVAKVIGTDPKTDIALLKVEASQPLPFVSFGDSNAARVGDWVIAMGNPLGQGFSVSAGIVSARNRALSGTYDDYIQTDAAINRGNSGGPLFNMDGEVIGVNTAILSPDGGSVGIGFSVPSDLVQDIVADLSDDGEITRGWLGVQIRPMTAEVAQVLGLDAPKGAVIEAIGDDSPAKKAGLEKGDIILSFNDTEIKELRDLTRAVAETDPEAKAEVMVLHKGKEVTRTVTIGTLADQKA